MPYRRTSFADDIESVRRADIAPPLTARRDVTLTRVADQLWRVVDRRGLVIGHLQAIEHPLGVRYRAQRFRAALGRFQDVGEFWSPDDTISSLRSL